ncbi:MAG: hypothetical protein GC179_16745 [Anaerolineaceae bacterium]|nr:hypothetical protein [Anaerolineaceae bacterium]
MAEPKPQYKTIDEYINAYPEKVRPILQTLRQTIKEEVPEVQEAIKYGMPTFIYHGNLVYFGAWKKHVGFYPITRSMEESIEELANYKTSGKGTIQFPYNQPLPLPLIRTIIQFRVREHLVSKEQNK